MKNKRSWFSLETVNEYQVKELKPNVIGSDLEIAILKIMNIIKNKSEFPKCLQD